MFDFDGTLVDSNAIKAKGFDVVCEALPRQGSEALLEARSRFPTGDRHVLLGYVARRIAKCPQQVEPLTRQLTAEYGRYCRSQIATCPPVPGSEATLSQLRRDGYLLFVNSATPVDALKQSIDDRGLTGYFHGVHGGPNSKTANLDAIAVDRGLRFSEILVVGDGLDDYRSALARGAHFVGLIDDYRLARSSALTHDVVAADTRLINDFISFTEHVLPAFDLPYR